MAWHDQPDHPFAGMAEKLERADQNVFNLHNEIAAFFQKYKYPTLPNPNMKEWQEAVDYHRNLRIPDKRFGVLTGEIVHHLRSCLDHVVLAFFQRQREAVSPDLA